MNDAFCQVSLILVSIEFHKNPKKGHYSHFTDEEMGSAFSGDKLEREEKPHAEHSLND